MTNKVKIDVKSSSLSVTQNGDDCRVILTADSSDLLKFFAPAEVAEHFSAPDLLVWMDRQAVMAWLAATE